MRPKRKTAKEIAAETRPRIDATKLLSLDERIAVLEDINVALGIEESSVVDLSTKQDKAIKAELIRRGYEPMMFNHAGCIILSRYRSVEL